MQAGLNADNPILPSLVREVKHFPWLSRSTTNQPARRHQPDHDTVDRDRRQPRSGTTDTITFQFSVERRSFDTENPSRLRLVPVGRFEHGEDVLLFERLQ